MAHGPSDRVSSQLQWRIPHNVANFSKLATMSIIPIIVLGFIMFLLVLCKIALRKYGVMLIPPKIWDKQHANVINGRKMMNGLTVLGKSTTYVPCMKQGRMETITMRIVSTTSIIK